MFCTHCGKSIENNSKFCPYCGSGLSASGTENVKDTLKKTAGAVADSAKIIGNSVNEATNGQAQKYAEKAKETAKGFTDDVKQVAKDKDASNFFTKNKYRNVKIIAVLLIAVFILGSLFGGDSSNYFEDFAKEKSEEFIVDRMLIGGGGYTNVKAYDIDLVATCSTGNSTENITLYGVTMSIKGKDSSGKSVEENYYVIMMINDNVSENSIKNGTVSNDDYGTIDFGLIQEDMSAYKKQLKENMEDLQKTLNDNK